MLLKALKKAKKDSLIDDEKKHHMEALVKNRLTIRLQEFCSVGVNVVMQRL